jgi:uncharacterized protein (DUF1330 family)
MKGRIMTVFMIADIEVTDDRWVESYCANVHGINQKHGGLYSLFAEG